MQHNDNKNKTAIKIIRDSILEGLPAFADPASVGRKLASLFCSEDNVNNKHYKEAVTWYGALETARVLGDNSLIRDLTDKYKALEGSYSELLESEGHVDNNVFGIVPLEIFLIDGNRKFLEEGLKIANHQCRFIEKQKRYAIDDMYMITKLQLQAFRCSSDIKYLDTAAATMTDYLKELQQPDGLFYHHRDFHHKWGRGNGWVAAGMAELLNVLPENHNDFPAVISGYKKMMKGLLEYQIREGTDKGLWKQIVDSRDSRNWAETSGSAMFCFAIISGVINGFLDSKIYGSAAREAWAALVSRLDSDGKLVDISRWGYKPLSHPESGDRYDNDEENYYFERQKVTGDNHGQAPMLWTASLLV